MKSKHSLDDLTKEQLIQIVLSGGSKRDIQTKGSYVEGNASVEKGDFVLRDKGLSGNEINKIINTVLKYFPKVAHQPAQLESTLQQFFTLHEELYEWKELHNYLNMILNALAPFTTRTDRAGISRRIPTLRELRNLWIKVSKRVGSLITWAETIKHIGKRYQLMEDGSVRGEKWAVNIGSIRDDIDQLLGMAPCKDDVEKSAQYPNRFYRLGFQMLRLNLVWWNELDMLTQDFESYTTEFMFQTDKHLRKTATDLYYHSKQALDRNLQME